MTYHLVKDIFNHAFTQSSAAQIVGIGMIVVVLYLLRKVKTIEYDDIKCILYVYDPRVDSEIEIPVEKIDKILYSSLGFGNGSRSYLIIYRDNLNQRKKVRLFPTLLSNHIDTIISDTKLRNPGLVTRNWSVGWNELSD